MFQYSLKIITKFPKFENVSTFHAWMNACVRQKFCDFITAVWDNIIKYPIQISPKHSNQLSLFVTNTTSRWTSHNFYIHFQANFKFHQRNHDIRVSSVSMAKKLHTTLYVHRNFLSKKSFDRILLFKRAQFHLLSMRGRKEKRKKFQEIDQNDTNVKSQWLSYRDAVSNVAYRKANARRVISSPRPIIISITRANNRVCRASWLEYWRNNPAS